MTAGRCRLHSCDPISAAVVVSAMASSSSSAPTLPISFSSPPPPPPSSSSSSSSVPTLPPPPPSLSSTATSSLPSLSSSVPTLPPPPKSSAPLSSFSSSLPPSTLSTTPPLMPSLPPTLPPPPPPSTTTSTMSAAGVAHRAGALRLPTATTPPSALLGGEPVVVSLVRSPTGEVTWLVWDADAAARLRRAGGLAVSPIGLCPAKLGTGGKAAAVPVVLSDAEAATAHANGWLVGEDGVTGRRDGVDLTTLLAAAVAARPQLAATRLVHYDLWAAGYRTTTGLKFGVDFLAYLGDPSEVHAAFMVVVAPEGAGIAPLDLVARSRVATTALKTCVLAYADVAAGTVRYTAFKRMGPGTAIFDSASSLLAATATAGAPPPPPVPVMPAAAAAATGEHDDDDGGDGLVYMDPADLFSGAPPPS